MSDHVVILCADGSEFCTDALASGWAILAEHSHPLVVTVVENPDTTMLTGSGFAGSVMTPAEFELLEQETMTAGKATVADTATSLGLADAETAVLRGDPAAAICQLAHDRGAAAIVIGSRGRGGIKRALLGSVSDHVVRHAPCPVVVTPERHEG